MLKTDIRNVPSHTFGEHKKCAELQYFCQKTTVDEENSMAEFKKFTTLASKISEITENIARHSKSLMFNVDNNIVEQFNAIIAKFTGGKRINFALKPSYQSRCSAAVVSHNSKKPIYKIYKYFKPQGTPSKIVKYLDLRRERKASKNQSCTHINKKKD